MKNNAKISGAIRHLLTAGGGYLAGAGYIDADNVEALAGAVMIIGGALWSYFAPEKKK